MSKARRLDDDWDYPSWRGSDEDRQPPEPVVCKECGSDALTLDATRENYVCNECFEETPA